MNNLIVETRRGSIKVVQFNKPRRKNAICPDMYVKVTKIFKEAAEDDEVSMLVLTGTGDYYSSGNDLVEVEKTNETYLVRILKEYVKSFITFPKTLVAIVNGPAIGIAATTLGLCDLVFAAENAFFYTPFTKLGIVAEGCSTYTFPRLMGDRKATMMLLYNYKMSAKEALECGFVSYVYNPDDVQSEVWNKIIEVSQLPQRSILGSKKLIKAIVRDDLLKTNAREMEELHEVWNMKSKV